ncbi:MAG: hypothetical protein KGH61_00400 [Candidatus Micrarchaeota archaeon]|nr:hypothetical protein [Candidatus Micrarchaeota archaeon]MDE1847397.1 hypothetical protein [Candidatus Micrarchaeota archaeon]MDE1864012.1 hypothetical protein [Candidatus Micrarchaeota archaeon]
MHKNIGKDGKTADSLHVKSLTPEQRLSRLKEIISDSVEIPKERDAMLRIAAKVVTGEFKVKASADMDKLALKYNEVEITAGLKEELIDMLKGDTSSSVITHMGRLAMNYIDGILVKTDAAWKNALELLNLLKRTVFDVDLDGSGAVHEHARILARGPSYQIFSSHYGLSGAEALKLVAIGRELGFWKVYERQDSIYISGFSFDYQSKNLEMLAEDRNLIKFRNFFSDIEVKPQNQEITTS